MKKHYQKQQWLAFEWPGYHIYQMIAPMKAWHHDFTRYGLQVSKLAVTYSRGTTGFYCLKNEYEGFGAKFFEQVRRRPEIMFRVLKEVDQIADKIFALGEKWQGKNFALFSDRELLAHHQQLFKLDERLWRRGQIQNLLELHNNYLTSYIRQIVPDQDFNILTTSRYVSVAERQDEDFLKLFEKTKKLKRAGTRTRQLVERHWRKYAWMTYGWVGPALTQEYFLANLAAARKKLKVVSKIEAKKQARQQAWREQEKILRGFSERDQKLITLLRTLLESKAKRVDAHSLTFFIGDQILAEIGRRVGLSMNQLRVVPPAEVSKLFRKVDQNAINREYDFVLYWFEKPNHLIKLVGQKAREKMRPILATLPKVKAASFVSGELAFPGKVKGRVKIILDAKDVSKFKAGEILVTRMTDPGYVPIMKVAKAIVTDIGGITCHAAIVSRELGVPCVIGTKNATQILKDGDLVEVDAEKGIVRKLK